MKKLITLVIALALTTSMNAQWWGKDKVKGNGNVITENRNLGEFDGVASAGFMDVEIVSGKEGEITLKGESNLLKHIETEIKKGILKIKVEEGYQLRPSAGNKILITVPVNDISSISLAGSGDIVTKTKLKATDFEVRLAGSGDINAHISTESMRVKMAGSGDIGLKGDAAEAEYSLAGSGDIDAFDLKAQNVKVNISGSGDVNVHCDGVLKARIAGSGDVHYKGTPTMEDSKSAGSGKIKKA
ncbi:head GIN domain-containing protein [Ascidiimonas aurantiaca]|uniref:head GIN domain-containing protein n=1 Tax=Ascidiimonas aurantiaca TaxID=1685432 RepID=UPI0030EDCFFD